MDDDVKEALDELRKELREARRSPSPQRDRDVREAREDLDDVLRREGYRLSRRELDQLVDEQNERKQRELFERWYEERTAAEQEDNEDGEEKIRYDFRRGWPCKWDSTPMNAGGNEPVIESIEITHEGLDRKL